MTWHASDGQRSPEPDGPPERFEPRPAPPRPGSPWRLPGTSHNAPPNQAGSSGRPPSPSSERPPRNRDSGAGSSHNESGRPPGGPSRGGPRRVPGGDRAWPSWLPWVAVILLLSVAVVPLLMQKDSGRSQDYTSFMTAVRDRAVDTVDISNSTGHITAVLKNQDRQSISGPLPLPPNDLTVIRNNAKVRFHSPKGNLFCGLLAYAFPFVLLIGLWVWMSRRAQGQMNGIMSVGRSRAKVWTDRKSVV